ncbi:efflux RND transporter permease subunit [Sulfurospirillum arcachonense]|uniref:efflux RND transporter permease subunit n=1 Tax=Sulfurospirillum arcachonense TaxID=57666 RepID=UPI000468CE8B|nr:efflux RND transporter permease subunit [Sulfurospirillum arcachonense]
MHTMTRYFIYNPVAANLLMLLILIGGYFTLSTLRIEGLPKIPADTITIETSFSGASVQQIDEQITQKLERALEGLDGVKDIWSISTKELSSITVQKRANYDIQKLLDNIRIRIDSVASLPHKADHSIIKVDDFDFPALYIQMYGESQDTIQLLSERLRKELLSQPEISHIKTWGKQKHQIRIEFIPSNLERYNLTIDDVSKIIQSSSLFFETGELKSDKKNIILKADAQAYYIADYMAIPILEFKDGRTITLGEIAHVSNFYENEGIAVRFNTKNTVGMEILIGRTENLLVISDVVKKVVNNFNAQLPNGIQTSIWGDASNYIKNRLNLLRNNAIVGLFLVILILSLFLHVKLAFWVAMGIPISIGGTITLMATSWVDYSLNDITTFGMIIALGILVDDAVVIGESIFEERKTCHNPQKGTLKGVQKVAIATIFGTLTTITAFAPMLTIDNAMGKLLASFSGIVILTLLFSLFESKFILPSHLAQISLNTKKNTNFISHFWNILQQKAQNTLEWIKHILYVPLLSFSLTHRYAVLGIFISILILCGGLIANGKIRSVFYPEIPGQIITINLEMDKRAPKNLLNTHVKKIENAIEELNQNYASKLDTDRKLIENCLIVINDAQSAEVYAELLPENLRKNIETLKVLEAWKHKIGYLEGSQSIKFSGSEEMAGGFEIRLYSENTQDLKSSGEDVKKFLSNIKGVSNIRSYMYGGKPQLQLQLKPEAKHLGFTTETLAQQIGHLFGGAEAQKIQRDNQEIRVIVKSKEQSRKNINDLLHTRVKSDTGEWYSLLRIAKIKSGYTSEIIDRRNSKRINTIKAFVDKSFISPSIVSQSIFTELAPKLAKKYPNVRIAKGGELEEMGEVKKEFVKALLIAIIVIYVLIAVPLKSYWQPFVILSVVPFGFIGAAFGHLIINLPLSILSLFGILALTGITVNDSLVLVTTYNQSKEKIHTTLDALQDASLKRFKAIFLTTITTVAGLTPLIMETSEQAQYLIPAAVSLVFGEIFATLITLIIVPILLAILNDLKEYVL